MSILRLLRIEQWVKNGFLFFPAFFAAAIFREGVLLHVTLGALCFSLAASAVYAFNDLLDVEQDRQHPTKRLRPIASGAVSPGTAAVTSALLIIAALSLAWWIDQRFTLVLGIYALMNLLYTLKLKHFSVLDVTIIALGFVLRIIAGGVLAQVFVSHWIILMIFLLALFIALAKRRDDLIQADGGTYVRKSIDGYNLRFVDAAMIMLATITIQSYILYTVSEEVIARMGSTNLFATSAFVLLGLLRYFQLTFVAEKTGSPTRLVLSDLPLQAVIVGWVASFALILYAF